MAESLKLQIIDYFDDKTNIGRICKADQSFFELKNNILDKFENVRIVNNLSDEMAIENVGIISGFGLKNPEYIILAKNNNLDI